ncbi:MAG: hypothetical protein K2N82_00095 [Lachnospiraceae bacterium]|nr:hypothetical protein [Lachnospiraceae bacterium]
MNSRGISSLITQNRLLSQARSRSRNSSSGMAAALTKGSSSGKSNALAEALKKKNAGKNSLSEADQSQKEAYTVVKKTAENIKKRAERLLSWPEKSVDEMTDEEKTTYKKSVTDEVSALIVEYNDMMKGMTDACGKVNEIYISQMKGYFQNAQKQLAELGITENTNGKLTLDKEKLASADVAKIKEVLGKKGTFIDDIGKRAENVLSNAETNLAVLNKSQYAGNYTYNQYGSDIFDALTSGSKYNYKS